MDLSWGETQGVLFAHPGLSVSWPRIGARARIDQEEDGRLPPRLGPDPDAHSPLRAGEDTGLHLAQALGGKRLLIEGAHLGGGSLDAIGHGASRLLAGVEHSRGARIEGHQVRGWFLTARVQV